MNTKDSSTQIAGHVAHTRYEDLPPAAIDKMKTFLIDTIGVGIAGSSGAQISELKETVRGWGDKPEATVWLTGERMSAQSAAIVNAYQIHCQEFDCVHEGAVLHPMATILSAVFAWIEREKTQGRNYSGRELLTALVLGVDISTILGIAANGGLRFFRPATAGGFGAAAAIAKLAGFDETQVKNVLGAQYSQASGTLQAHVEATPMLGLQVGLNARSAIVSADLTKAGFRAPHDVFTGQYGYFALFEENNYDLHEGIRNFRRRFPYNHMQSAASGPSPCWAPRYCQSAIQLCQTLHAFCRRCLSVSWPCGYPGFSWTGGLG